MLGSILLMSTIIDQCKNKQWEEMYMCFAFKDMSPKLLVNASILATQGPFSLGDG